jgi:hypothetical protein
MAVLPARVRRGLVVVRAVVASMAGVTRAVVCTVCSTNVTRGIVSSVLGECNGGHCGCQAQRNGCCCGELVEIHSVSSCGR